MKKTEVIALLSERLGCTKKHVKETLSEVDAMVEILAEEVETDCKAKLGEYIVIEKKHIPCMTRRNPSTGEVFEAEAKDVVKIKFTHKAKEVL